MVNTEVLQLQSQLSATLRGVLSDVVPLLYPYHTAPVHWLITLLSSYYSCRTLTSQLKNQLIVAVLKPPKTAVHPTPGSGPLHFLCPALGAAQERELAADGGDRCVYT